MKAPQRLTWRQVYRQFGPNPNNAATHDAIQNFRRRTLRELKKMVDFDNNCIWGPLLTKAVGSLLPNAAREKLLAEKPEFVEDALDLLFSCTNREKIIKATLEWIRTTTVAGYHGSRLIDLEVALIQSAQSAVVDAPGEGV